jgi:hypothetical protein
MTSLISLIGQAYAGGDATALFKEIDGEVLRNFRDNFTLTGMIQERAVPKGSNRITFPVMTRTSSSFFARGTTEVRLEADGKPKQDRRSIYIDRPQYTKVVLDKQDAEFSSIDDIISEITTELAYGLAKTKEELALRAGVLTARIASKGTAGSIDEIHGGGLITDANIATNSDTLYSKLLDAAAMLDKKSVPGTDRYLFVDPDMYNLCFDASTKRNALFSRDLGGSGSIQGRELLFAAGFKIVPTLSLPKTNITGTAHSTPNVYDGDFTKTKALILHKSAIGIANSWAVTTKESEENNPLQTELTAYTSYGIGAVNPQGAIELATP